jgi:hypothetical protein
MTRTTVTPDQAFTEIEPELTFLAEIIKNAPCNRAGLAAMVATYFCTVAGLMAGFKPNEGTRVIATTIAAAVDVSDLPEDKP